MEFHRFQGFNDSSAVLTLRKKSRGFLTFPMQDQNKKEKLILWFMIFANHNDSWEEMWVACVCHCTSLSSNECVQAGLLGVYFT